ncbi:MAG: zf-HC2 domain-containing protein [Verrucomicrobiota bacterium]
MKPHNPELINALLDGELTGLRRWLVQRHVGRCALCAVEYRRLRHVRQILAANPVLPLMSDSPDFFWSKVKRDIQAEAGRTETVPVPQLSLADWLGQHRAAFVSAAAAIVAVIGVSLVLSANRATAPALAGKVPLATVQHVATALPNTTATAFEAQEADATVIWVSGLPWTKDMTEMQTLFATIDS